MIAIDRRRFVAISATTLAMPWVALAAQGAELQLMTAGPGSAFLPYGQGLAKVLGAANITIAVKETKGSNENLSTVDASPSALGAAFLGSAFEAITGTGFAAGKKHLNVCALFPMYETAFMAAALKARNITALKGLDGGPAAGPAEGFF